MTDDEWKRLSVPFVPGVNLRLPRCPISEVRFPITITITNYEHEYDYDYELRLRIRRDWNSYLLSPISLLFTVHCSLFPVHFYRRLSPLTRPA